MDYSDAVAQVRDHLIYHHGQALATVVRFHLAKRILTLDTAISETNAERATATHIRKMSAEGEIIEEVMNKRLFYKLPVHV